MNQLSNVANSIIFPLNCLTIRFALNSLFIHVKYKYLIPFQYTSLWIVSISGMIGGGMPGCLTQMAIQRYLLPKSLKDARSALWLSALGVLLASKSLKQLWGIFSVLFIPRQGPKSAEILQPPSFIRTI